MKACFRDICKFFGINLRFAVKRYARTAFTISVVVFGLFME